MNVKSLYLQRKIIFVFYKLFLSVYISSRVGSELAQFGTRCQHQRILSKHCDSSGNSAVSPLGFQTSPEQHLQQEDGLQCLNNT